eukprot:TRINITY_DN15872_c0_g1_i3.p1 TRINITY_DN15872_c0_g1~~TRINITY_DN15872_c0_g1_i3.p1  ORF type:complete len:690 (-),score=145.45 TRINITY_DN15872_c0_g1_i3:170-2239(-)
MMKNFAAVSIQLFCGDEPISKPSDSSGFMIEENGDVGFKSNSFLNTNIPMCNLPRDTKIHITLYNLKDKEKDRVKGKFLVNDHTPIAWVNCLLYNYKHELRQGKCLLPMWEGDPSVMGTCVPNLQDPLAIQLSVEFDTYPSEIVVFPTEPLNFPPLPQESAPTKEEQRRLDRLVNLHSLSQFSPETRAFMWKHRCTYLIKYPQSLPKYLMSVPKTNKVAVQEMHQLLEKWPEGNPLDAFELLDARFTDHRIRSFAVQRLEKLTNAEIEDYLPQLVQVLKYETNHDSPLCRFLLRRAIRNRRIAHYLFWFLRAEVQQPQLTERFVLMIEAFLKGGGSLCEQLQAQVQVHKGIVEIANKMKASKGPVIPLLKEEICKLNSLWPKTGCQLTLEPYYVCSGIVAEKCKVLDTKTKPLWLTFENKVKGGSNIPVIFKCGEDLRQDMLSLQIFGIMDKMWKKKGLDIKLNPYVVLPTGEETGMLEVVRDTVNVAKLHKEATSAMTSLQSPFNTDAVLLDWLAKENEEKSLEYAVKNFTASCAGHCVASYILGIGDRHNDNLLLRKDGNLFNINFDTILGNCKKKSGVKKERVLFSPQPDWIHVMGGKGSTNYNVFLQNCAAAYDETKKNGQLFINLFTMMLMSGIPELQTKTDIRYIVESLQLEGTSQPFRQIMETEHKGSFVHTLTQTSSKIGK